MNNWNVPANDILIKETIDALSKNGIQASLVQTEEEAKQKVLSLIPKQAEVMTMPSATLLQTGLEEIINKSGEYTSVRSKLISMDRNTQAREMAKLGAAPDYAIGSIHAVTKEGHVYIASKTGSQIPAYAFGAGHVVWVVGTQKIVQSREDALKRIYEYTLPLESERANKAYNITTGSEVAKMLVINHEISPGRINLIFINKNIGF